MPNPTLPHHPPPRPPMAWLEERLSAEMVGALRQAPLLLFSQFPSPPVRPGRRWVGEEAVGGGGGGGAKAVVVGRRRWRVSTMPWDLSLAAQGPQQVPYRVTEGSQP
ncbi:unnamed protein product [Merluccius merluccius]